MSGSFGDALDSLRGYRGDEALLAEAFTAAFPVTGVTVTALGGIVPAGIVSATDAVGARLAELQLDLGEGPNWDAVRSAAPVLEPDVQNRPLGVWPAFTAALAVETVGAVFSFPMRVGRLGLGAICLHSEAPMALSAGQIAQSTALADVVGLYILRRSLKQLGDEGENDTIPDLFSRRPIHQATGMVIAQLGVPGEDAELLIRGHAFATSTSMRAVAEDILAGQLAFDRNTMNIEDR